MKGVFTADVQVESHTDYKQFPPIEQIIFKYLLGSAVYSYIAIKSTEALHLSVNTLTACASCFRSHSCLRTCLCYLCDSFAVASLHGQKYALTVPYAIA